MKPDLIRRWLADMRSSGYARYDSDCARLLGVSPETIRMWKAEGVPELHAKRTALAMRAALHGLEPYGEEELANL